MRDRIILAVVCYALFHQLRRPGLIRQAARKPPMLVNSRELGMSGQSSHMSFSASQIPEKSGLPSGVRGVDAPRFGTPLGVLGTPAVGYLIHWLASGVASAAAIGIELNQPFR
jgi:hypothetical protein